MMSADAAEVGVRVCTRCGVEKATTEFYRDRSRKDGRRPACKACGRAHREATREANRDKVAERDRAYREANRDKIAERKRAYREANSDKVAEWKRAYREANRERAREVDRAWCEANPEAKRANRQRRRARKADATVEAFTHADLLASWDERGLYSCTYCGGEFEHIDHAEPLALGGEHSPRNLVPACASCNLRKQASPAAEFALRRARERHGDVVADRLAALIASA